MFLADRGIVTYFDGMPSDIDIYEQSAVSLFVILFSNDFFIFSLSKSNLLSIITRCLSLHLGIICSDSCLYCFSAQVASMTHRTIFACSNFWKLRLMPRDSIASVVSRMPAVSIKRNVIPSRFIVSSITSRVVPWISLTMARSSFSKAFNNVDFPAFVSPTIATGTPFLWHCPY